MTKDTPPAKPVKRPKIATKDRGYNTPPGMSECSIHYYLAFCDCPKGT